MSEPAWPEYGPLDRYILDTLHVAWVSVTYNPARGPRALPEQVTIHTGSGYAHGDIIRVLTEWAAGRFGIPEDHIRVEE